MVQKDVDTATGNFDWSTVGYAEAFDRFPDIVSSDEVLGDGFRILSDKAQAIGREFLIIDWSFHQGDKGEFVSMRIINPQNEKARINDGSTGICAQLKKLSEKGIHGGVHCARGLRVSEYTIEDGSKAKTYYLA